MIEVFLMLIMACHLVLCFIALRIAHAIENVKIQVTLQNHHTVTIERDDDDDDSAEAWKNN